MNELGPVLAMAFGLACVVLKYKVFRLRRSLRDHVRLIGQQEEHIQEMTADMLVLIDERNRYKGAWSALSYNPLNHFIMPAPTLDEEINRMNGPVREGDDR